MFEKLLRRCCFHYLTCVHDCDAIRHSRDDAEVVRDEQNSHIELSLERFHQLQNLRLHSHIQRCRRFIRNKQFGIVRQCDCDHYALTHSA